MLRQFWNLAETRALAMVVNTKSHKKLLRLRGDAPVRGRKALSCRWASPETGKKKEKKGVSIDPTAPYKMY